MKREIESLKIDGEKMEMGKKRNGEYYVGEENKKGREIRGKEGNCEEGKGDRRGR